MFCILAGMHIPNANFQSQDGDRPSLGSGFGYVNETGGEQHNHLLANIYGPQTFNNFAPRTAFQPVQYDNRQYSDRNEIAREQELSPETIKPDLATLFLSNDMRQRVNAAMQLQRNGVEVMVQNNTGTYQVIVERGINSTTRQEAVTVKLRNQANPREAGVIAELPLENGQFARYTPPAPPEINLTGARVMARFQNQSFTVGGDELRAFRR